MARTRTLPTLDREGGFLTYREGDNQHCVGYLIHHEGRVFDARFGELPNVTETEAEIHNKLFSEAQIKGLFDTCEVGQSGMFYMQKAAKGQPAAIRTFVGTVVAEVTISGGYVKFTKHGKSYVGRASKEDDTISITRVA